MEKNNFFADETFSRTVLAFFFLTETAVLKARHKSNDYPFAFHEKKR